MQQVAKANVWRYQLSRIGCSGVEPRNTGQSIRQWTKEQSILQSQKGSVTEGSYHPWSGKEYLHFWTR